MAQSKPIVIVSHSSTTTGGGEQAMLELADFLKLNGLNPHFIIPAKGALSDALQERQMNYVVCQYGWWTEEAITSEKNAVASQSRTHQPVSEIVDYLQSVKPMACVTNTTVIPWGAIASAIAAVPHVWFVHEISFAGSEINYSLEKDEVLRDINALSDLVIANSNTTRQYLSPDVSPDKIKLLYPTPDIDKVISLAKQPVDDMFTGDGLRLIVTGRVNDHKKQVDAVRAVGLLVAKGYKLQLALIGDVSDDYKKEIQEIVAHEGLRGVVTLTGHVDNPYKYIQRADLSLCCSLVESYGRASIEAMMIGKPVIGANNSGTAEIIEDGVNGLLYETANVDDLADKIESVLVSHEYLKKLSEGARRSAIDQYAVAQSYKEEFISSLKSLTYTDKPLRSTLRYVTEIQDTAISTSRMRMERQVQELTRRATASESNYQRQLARTKQLEAQLKDILSSKAWKVGNGISKIYRKTKVLKNLKKASKRSD